MVRVRLRRGVEQSSPRGERKSSRSCLLIQIHSQVALNPGQEPVNVHRYVFRRLRIPQLNSMARAAFLEAVVRQVDMSRVSFQKRCTKVVQASDSPELVVHFADGTTAMADVVVGADGIKSAVRGAVISTDPGEAAVFSQTSCYRGLIPAETLKAAGVKTDLTARPHCFFGPGKVGRKSLKESSL